MKILYISLFLLLIIPLSSACQYKENETYSELEWGLYDSGGDLFGPPLEFNDFSGGSMNIQGCNPPSFIVYNPLGKEITLNISYTTSWSTAFGSRSQNHQGTITISQYSNSSPLTGSCPDIGSGSISQESISYVITSPKLLTLKNEQVTKQREICKICPNGKVCLDDGASCDLAIACGSDICNEDKKCGEFNGCSEGKVLCENTLCLMPSIKTNEQAYQCDWECDNGTIACDGICRGVSVKKSGEEYHCVQECKSGRGREGKCLLSVKGWVYWIIGVILVTVLIGLFINFFRKKGPLERKIKELEIKLKDLEVASKSKEREIKELEKQGTNLIKVIEKNDDLISIKNKEINSLNEIVILKEEELKGVKGSIRKETENELERLKKKREEISKERKSLREENNRLEEEQNRKEELAIKRYGGPKKVKLDGEYIRFVSNLKKGEEKKEGKRYHVWLYRSKFPETPSDYQIHHIDGDKLNNEMWNLIALRDWVHREEVKEGVIKGEEWEFGLNYLLKGIIKEKDLHNYIKRHRREIKKKRRK